MGWEIRIDGGSIIDVGTTKPYTVTGLSPGVMHSAEVRRYNDGGLRSDWSSPVYFYTFDEVAIRIDSGRTTGGVVSGYDVDTAYLTSASAAGNFADTVDITGLTDPAPASAYSTYREYNSEAPEYTRTGLELSRAYLIRLHFNEGNESHVIGNSVMNVKINGSIAAPIRDSAYRNSPYFDVRERAGAFHKGYIREYIGTSNGSGELVVKVDASLNNSAADVRVAAVEIKEAPPLAAFTATPGSDQTDAVMFTDLTMGLPTSWAWDFGDGETSTTQHPSHTYDAAGTYEVTLIASNRFGDSEEYSASVTVLTGKAPSISPSTLPDATDGDAYSQALSAVDGDSPYTFTFITEAAAAIEYTDLGSGKRMFRRRGALPTGLSLSAGSITGTPNLTAAKPSLIVLEGDSIFKGFVSGDPALTADYQPGAVLASLLHRSWKVINVATSGEDSTQTLAQYATQVSPYFDDYEYCVAMLGIGTNDIINGVAEATIISNIQDWATAAKADGFLVVLRKIPVYWAWSGAQQTKAANVNTAMDSMTGVDAVWNMMSDPLLANGHHNTYWRDGGIHPTDLGYIREAAGMKTAIDTLTPNGTGNVPVDYLFGVKVVDASGNAATKQYTLTVNP